MTRVCAAAIAFAIVMPAEPSAHRLDEYLQAARLSLARDRVTLELDLTPGANIATSIVALLDRDGDDTISPTEAGAYGQAVLADLVLALDGRPVALSLTRVEAPSIDEMRDGSGTIQVRAAGQVDVAASGRRRLDFRNNHQTGGEVSTSSTRSFHRMATCVSWRSRAIIGSREFASNTTSTRDGSRSCYGWSSAPPEWRRSSGGVRLLSVRPALAGPRFGGVRL